MIYEVTHETAYRYESPVVLSDVGGLSPQFENELKSYVRGGGSVLISLGRMAVARMKVPVSAERECGNGQQRNDERHRQAVNDADRRERDRGSVEVFRKQHRDSRSGIELDCSAREHTVVSRPAASFLVTLRA